jgi:CDGSH-type Zn-finger protein
VKSEKDNKKPVIECYKDGPYIVKDLEKLQNSKGEKIQSKSVISLCRCGASEDKPFCDGKHVKVGYSSARFNDGRNDHRDNYVGKEITIHDNRSICAHSAFCTDCLPSVFQLGQKPWIHPNAATVNEIIETIKKCPSGALSYSIRNIEYRDQDRDPMLFISKDGPYYVKGWIDCKKDEPWCEGASKEHYTLCRCGGSKNKPFCDGTHWYIKFKDEKN